MAYFPVTFPIFLFSTPKLNHRKNIRMCAGLSRLQKAHVENVWKKTVWQRSASSDVSEGKDGRKYNLQYLIAKNLPCQSTFSELEKEIQHDKEVNARPRHQPEIQALSPRSAACLHWAEVELSPLKFLVDFSCNVKKIYIYMPQLKHRGLNGYSWTGSLVFLVFYWSHKKWQFQSQWFQDFLHQIINF